MVNILSSKKDAPQLVGVLLSGLVVPIINESAAKFLLIALQHVNKLFRLHS